MVAVVSLSKDAAVGTGKSGEQGKLVRRLEARSWAHMRFMAPWLLQARSGYLKPGQQP